MGLSLAVLLGFGALSVDIGLQRVADAQVQAAIEAGTLGGAGYLNGTRPGAIYAKSRAEIIANSNPVIGSWAVAASEVEVGIWDFDLETFTPYDPTLLVVGDPLVQQINAVRITSGHTSIRSILAGVAFGKNTMTTSNESLAVRPPGGPARSVPCYLPLAIPDCEFLDWLSGSQTENPPPILFQFNSDPDDNIGWANPFVNPSTTTIQNAFINEGCHDESLELDDTMNLGNGENVSAQNYIADILNGDNADRAPETWDTDIAPRPDRLDSSEYPENDTVDPSVNDPSKSYVTQAAWDAGNVIQGPVALVDPGTCGSGVSFTGTMPVSGFVWAMIYDGKSTGNPKNLFVQLDFINEHDMGGDTGGDGLGNVNGREKPILIY